jgi:hypothetical protein
MSITSSIVYVLAVSMFIAPLHRHQPSNTGVVRFASARLSRTLLAFHGTIVYGGTGTMHTFRVHMTFFSKDVHCTRLVDISRQVQVR